MITARKFTFDRSFAKSARPKPPAATFTADDLQAAREAAFLEGEAAGRQAAIESIEQATRQALDQLGQHIHQLFGQEDTRRSLMQAEAAQIGHALARKLAPNLLAENALAEVSAMVRDYLALYFDAPRLVIQVAPELADVMTELTERWCEEQAFGGTVIVNGAADLRGSDCRLEWADGGVERHEQQLQAELDRLVADFMEARRRAAAHDDGADNMVLTKDQPDGQ